MSTPPFIDRMTAVNPVVRHIYDFEERVWPAARRKNIGRVAMKVLGGMYKSEAEPAYKPQAKGGRITGADMEPSFRYALGLPGVTTAVVGCYNFHELTQVIDWARRFQPLSDDRLEKLLADSEQTARQWGEIHGPVD